MKMDKQKMSERLQSLRDEENRIIEEIRALEEKKEELRAQMALAYMSLESGFDLKPGMVITAMFKGEKVKGVLGLSGQLWVSVVMYPLKKNGEISKRYVHIDNVLAVHSPKYER